MEQEKNYVGYEYLSVSVGNDMKSVYADCYQNFGWIIDGFGSSDILGNGMTLKLKRDRRINNRTQLNEIQRKCEVALETIHNLENSKNTKAIMYALGLGILGTVFMAGAVFTFIDGYIVACIGLAIPAFLGWGFPYFLFKKIRREEINKINPKIDKQYECIYDLCDQANALL